MFISGVIPRSLFAVLLAMAPGRIRATLPHDPWLGWTTFSSAHFDVHVHDGLEELAPRVAADCEGEYTRLEKYFKFQPSTRIDVVLSDETDEANGETAAFPRNETFFVVAPPDAYDGEFEIDDWLRYLASHELTHAFHLDHARGFPWFMRYVFGRFLYFMPNYFQPTWIIEGLATWSETNPEAKIGRGQSSFFRGEMRLEVEHGIKSLREVNQPIEQWPAGNTRYLYGVYFMNFLQQRYGRDSIRRWTENYAFDGWPWLINRNAKKTFGKTFDQLWAEFSLWLQGQFQPEIDAIHKSGLRGLAAPSPPTGSYFWGPMKGLYAVRDDGITQQRLQKLEGGQWKNIADMNSIRFSPGPKRILAAESGWIDQARWSTDLMSIDPVSGAKRRLTRGLRVRDAVDMQQGIVVVAGEAGQKRLLLVDDTGAIRETLWQGHEGENPSTLAVSPDQTRLAASLWRKGSGWDLVEFDFSSHTWKELMARPEQELSPAWSTDGKSIFFSADYGGTFNIWKLDLGSGDLKQMTNVVGAALYPNPLDDQTLDFTLLTADGYERGELKMADALNAPAPDLPVAAIPLKEVLPVDVTHAPYSPWPSLLPTYWFPALQSAPGQGLYGGFEISNSDLLQRHTFDMFAMGGTSPVPDVFGAADYAYTRYLPWLVLGASRYPSNYLDDNGNIVRERVSEAWDAGLELPYSTAWSTTTLEAFASGRRNWDYWRAAGEEPFGEARESLFYGLAQYDSTRTYAESIGPSDGITFFASYSRLNPSLPDDASWINWGISRPTLLGGLNILELSVNGGVIEQGNYSFGLDQAPPVWASSLSFVPSYNLIGYPSGLASMQGAAVGSAHVGWRFPIVDVERGWMIPVLPVGVDKIYGRLIYEEGQAWNLGENPAAAYGSVGAELDSILVLGFDSPLLLSLGWAHGVDAGGENQIYIDLGGSVASTNFLRHQGPGQPAMP